MMHQMIFAMPGNEEISIGIRAGIHGEKGSFLYHQFPDGESYIRLLSDVKDRDVAIICTLYEPDRKILPLLFLAGLLREQKARSICLVAPYLAYMRQDKQFCPGEAVTSAYFAKLLSLYVDRLITIDPHLHRRASLSEIYSIPSQVIHSADLVSGWIKHNVAKPLIVGPDSESEQWVSEIARNSGASYIVLNKKRNGDQNVEISIPDLSKYEGYTPVLIDDIISSAGTMIETVTKLKSFQLDPAICIGIHPVFADNAYSKLKATGVSEIITCNTISHESNGIDISGLIMQALTSDK
jgi:ribose-phosphate pyrophosphokinase